MQTEESSSLSSTLNGVTYAFL